MRVAEFDLSICIVSWNSLTVPRDCLDSVHRHTGDFRVEIIVVDNASGDGTKKALRGRIPRRAAGGKRIQSRLRGGRTTRRLP